MAATSTAEFPMGIASAWAKKDNSALDEAVFRLQNSSYLELRRVKCALHKGTLTLSGHVSSHYLRQVAQATVLGLAGIESIDNRLEVLACVTSHNRMGAD